MANRFAHVRIRYRTRTQLGLLERFHRTLKEEEVYWRLYQSVAHARECLIAICQRYNHLLDLGGLDLYPEALKSTHTKT